MSDSDMTSSALSDVGRLQYNTIQYSTCIAPFSLGKPSDSEALATSGQSSVKAASNKKVFNLDLKALKSLVHLMSAGREIQTAGAA